jgi:hypothetical protein
MVVTRGMLKQKLLQVNIDFTAASKAWRENKIVLKNGCFDYIPPTPIVAKGYNLRSRRNQYEKTEKTI